MSGLVLGRPHLAGSGITGWERYYRTVMCSGALGIRALKLVTPSGWWADT